MIKPKPDYQYLYITCKGKGGVYKLICAADGAGTSRGTTKIVYQDAFDDLRFFVRDSEDFYERMELIPREQIEQAIQTEFDNREQDGQSNIKY